MLLKSKAVLKYLSKSYGWYFAVQNYKKMLKNTIVLYCIFPMDSMLFFCFFNNGLGDRTLRGSPCILTIWFNAYQKVRCQEIGRTALQ